MEERSVEKAVFLTNLVSYIMKAAGLVSSLLIIHIVSPQEFGLWKVALAVATVISSWFMAIHPVVTAEIIRSEVDETEKKHGHTLWRGYWHLTLLLGVATAILCALFGTSIDRLFGMSDVRLFYLAVLLVFLWVLKLHAQIWSKALYRFRPIVWGQTIEEVGYIIFILWFLYARHLGVLGLGYASVLSVVFGLCCSGTLIVAGWRRCPNTGLREDAAALWSVLRRHGKWAVGVKLLKDNIDSFRVWFIQWLAGPYAVGLYSFAQSLLGNFITLFSVESAFVATIARYVTVRDKFLQVLGEASRLSTIVYGVIFVVACVIVPVLVPYLFPAYVGGIPIFLLLSPFILMNGLYTILSNVFHIVRWQKALFLIYLGRVAFLAIMILLLGWKRPFLTVTLEFVIGTFLQVAAMTWVLRKRFDLHGVIRTLFVPTRRDLVALKDRVWKLFLIIRNRRAGVS